jgi:hypothetical protein
MEAFAVIEHILRNRKDFFDEIRASNEIATKIRDMLISSIFFFALYGAVMGSSNSALQALCSAIKLPILFLITLVICLPTLYFFNLLFGSRLTLPQTLALILTAITVTAVLTLSFAPISLFFWLTAPHYQFFKLLNVAILTLTGFFGLTFLVTGMGHVQQEDGRTARNLILRMWILIYGFVGTQMAWTLRPFLGAPWVPFQIFRQLESNFYVNVAESIWEILTSIG